MTAHSLIKRIKLLAGLVLLFLMLFTSACDQAGVNLAQVPDANQPQGSVSKAGSNTWIEFPAEGATYPLAPMTFAIYAADAQAVSRIDVWVNGEALAAGAPLSLSPDGNKDLVRLDQIWLPQAEGKYLLQAAGSGGGGQSDAPHVTFCIVTCQPGAVPLSTDTPSPAANITIAPGEITLTPSITPTGTVTIYPTAQVEYWAAPPYVNAGQCTTLNWNVSGAQSVSLGGSPVYESGTLQVCPCQTTSYTLSVVEMGGAHKDNMVNVTVSGICQGPTTAPPPLPVTTLPPPLPTTEVPPPQDTSGPSISGGGITWDGCKFFGQASFSDESGVSWAKFFFNVKSQGWKSLWMSAQGGIWKSDAGFDLGMDSPPWDIQYYFTASDSLGNSNEGGGSTQTFMSCGG